MPDSSNQPGGGPLSQERTLRVIEAVLRKECPDGNIDELRGLCEQFLNSQPAQDRQSDPARKTLAMLGDKWTILVLTLLGGAPLRYMTLQRLINALTAEGGASAISQRMLTLTLRSLEKDGFVRRTIWPCVPPRVEYSITPLGISLQQQVQCLIGWARAHEAEISKARGQFAESPVLQEFSEELRAEA
jgi:DNA-binding HxlR family transcriptional regulator